MAHSWRLTRVLIVLLAMVALAEAETRTWRDSTGKSEVEAELVDVQDGKVLLRSKDGRDITVPIERLSDQDQDYIAGVLDPSRDGKTGRLGAAPDAKAAKEVTKEFYEDLRTEDRSQALSLLTKDSQTLAEAGKSPLLGLPKPDKHKRAVRVGKAVVEGQTASVPVRVKAQGTNHSTILHLQLEDGQWRVFAISAQTPGGEKTLMFDQDPTVKKDPLAELVGKPLQVQGVTLDGRPIDWKAFEGKVVLIDFWATWCGPCRAEMPNVLENYKKYNNAGFEVIAVSVDKDLGALKAFLTEQQPPWTVLADRHPKNRASMAGALGVSGIPAFVLIGQDGRVAAVHCRGKRLGTELDKLLGDNGKKLANR